METKKPRKEPQKEPPCRRLFWVIKRPENSLLGRPNLARCSYSAAYHGPGRCTKGAAFQVDGRGTDRFLLAAVKGVIRAPCWHDGGRLDAGPKGGQRASL